MNHLSSAIRQPNPYLLRQRRGCSSKCWIKAYQLFCCIFFFSFFFFGGGEGEKGREQGFCVSRSPIIRSTMRLNLYAGHHKSSLCWMSSVFTKIIGHLSCSKCRLFVQNIFTIFIQHRLHVSLEFGGTRLCFLRSMVLFRFKACLMPHVCTICKYFKMSMWLSLGSLVLIKEVTTCGKLLQKQS